MIDYHKEIVATLEKILPTHYEMQLTSGSSLPCISYMELSNVDNSTGDTLGYSTLSFQVKVWAHSLQRFFSVFLFSSMTISTVLR